MPYKSLIFVIHSYKEEGTAPSNTIQAGLLPINQLSTDT
jgi:hypothetical protein